jgi:hypothetical protein
MSDQFRCNTCHAVYPDIQADGTPYYHACAPLVAEPLQERKYRRDENIAVSRSGKPRRAIGIIAEGKGVTCMSNPRLTEPARISALKARIAKEQE